MERLFGGGTRALHVARASRRRAELCRVAHLSRHGQVGRRTAGRREDEAARRTLKGAPVCAGGERGPVSPGAGARPAGIRGRAEACDAAARRACLPLRQAAYGFLPPAPAPAPICSCLFLSAFGFFFSLAGRI